MLVVAQMVCVMPSRSKCCWLRGSLTRAIAVRTPYAGGESEFRTDLERIRFAQSFSRLAEVTQVIPAGATGGVVS